jgi:hypothetical protein
VKVCQLQQVPQMGQQLCQLSCICLVKVQVQMLQESFAGQGTWLQLRTSTQIQARKVVHAGQHAGSGDVVPDIVKPQVSQTRQGLYRL